MALQPTPVAPRLNAEDCAQEAVCPLHRGPLVLNATFVSGTPVPVQSALGYLVNVTLPVGQGGSPVPPQVPLDGETSAWSRTEIVVPGVLLLMSMKLSVTSHPAGVGLDAQLLVPRVPATWKMWVAVIEFSLPTSTTSQLVAGRAIGG